MVYLRVCALYQVSSQALGSASEQRIESKLPRRPGSWASDCQFRKRAVHAGLIIRTNAGATLLITSILHRATFGCPSFFLIERVKVLFPMNFVIAGFFL